MQAPCRRLYASLAIPQLVLLYVLNHIPPPPHLLSYKLLHRLLVSEDLGYMWVRLVVIPLVVIVGFEEGEEGG